MPVAYVWTWSLNPAERPSSTSKHETSVSDPYQYFMLNTHPDTGFWWSKIGKNLQLKIFFYLLLSKTTIYLSLGIHKGRPSYRRSLQASALKREHSALQNMKFHKFFLFLGHFCPPGSGSGIHWPDWIRIQSGSGSETLMKCLHFFSFL